MLFKLTKLIKINKLIIQKSNYLYFFFSNTNIILVSFFYIKKI